MKDDILTRISEVLSSFEKIKAGFDLSAEENKLKELEAKTTDPDFWNDQFAAKETMQKIGDLKKEISQFKDLEKKISELAELAQSKDTILTDKSLADEFKRELSETEDELLKLKLTTYLSGKYDQKNAIVSIHAGQGGTEAMDWASMLFRMYLRYCEKRDWGTEIITETAGEEAGTKTVIFRVVGTWAYGYLKKEAGTHRLVRQSPFNADKLRQTSFALVEVLPEFEEVDLPDIEIKDDDLEWQFYRASSQGGQNVQKVSSAVRLIHKPTGIVVTAQTERFQEQNRKYALNLLRSKLWALEQDRAKKEKKKVMGEYTPATWGTQIRSYVLHPYKMVKDLRTEVETSDAEGVLNGEIDRFVEAELQAS